jgi:hypothetical protein
MGMRHEQVPHPAKITSPVTVPATVMIVLTGVPAVAVFMVTVFAIVTVVCGGA